MPTPKKPKAIKKIEGTYREDRDGGRNPEPDKLDNMPKCPTWVNRYGKRKWREVIPPLVDLGLIAAVDLPVLADAFYAFGEAQKIIRDVKERWGSFAGYFMERPEGKNFPLWQAYKQLTEKYTAIMYKFGVTPVERERITIESTKAEDTLDKMLSELTGKNAD